MMIDKWTQRYVLMEDQGVENDPNELQREVDLENWVKRDGTEWEPPRDPVLIIPMYLSLNLKINL